MFEYNKKTPSEATFKAKIVDYEVKNSSRDTNFEFALVDQKTGKEINLAEELPERYKAEVSISDLEVLIPPERENLKAREKDGFSVWLHPEEVQKLIQCHANDGSIVFDAGITHHRGMITFVRIHEYL